MKLLISLLLTLGLQALLVSSHGRFTNPPSRASAWRYGFDTPADYDDNGNNCGGFSNQWNKADGKCGICGDDWFANPREHEAPGGLYATGTITNSYTAGQTIPVTIEVTANHWGHFEFKLCANNDVTQDPTQECFDRTPVLTPEGSDKWYVPTHETRFFDFELVLPAGVTCEQCIMQWTYVAANSWGKADNGTECVGCGPQEHFRACADIEIK